MKGTTLTPSDAALLQATADPLAYIERSLAIRHMETDSLHLPWATGSPPPESFPSARIDVGSLSGLH